MRRGILNVKTQWIDYNRFPYPIQSKTERTCQGTQKKYDSERTSVLEGYGLTVIRFKNDEVINSFDVVCERIWKYYNERL